MKKDHLLSVLLLLSMCCITSIDVSAATSKSTHKNTAHSHKKSRSVQKSFVRQRQMSEKDITECTRLIDKDITECTRLIDKVAQTDKAIHRNMMLNAMANTKTDPHLKKDAEVQLFASDDPAAIAHLTGKATGPLLRKTYPRIATGPKTVPKIAVSPGKPIAKLPTDKQLFASNTSKPVLHVTTPSKSAAPHPRIELFAPNAPDLNHLEGKSANLANIGEPESDDNADKVKTKTKAHKKSKKSAHKSKKTAPTAEISEKTKVSGNIKTDETTVAVNNSGEKPKKEN